MSMNVANCPRCGKIYVKGFVELCPNCVKEQELQYEKCLKYLRENKSVNITELSDATGVSIKQITKFVREGRISIYNAPNMSYPCEVCGTLIRENTICELCRQKLVKDVRNTSEDERRDEERRQQENRITYNIHDRLKNKR